MHSLHLAQIGGASSCLLDSMGELGELQDLERKEIERMELSLPARWGAHSGSLILCEWLCV